MFETLKNKINPALPLARYLYRMVLGKFLKTDVTRLSTRISI